VKPRAAAGGETLVRRRRGEDRLLVTISGGAGAGKTTLAAELAATAARGPVLVLHCDDYYFAVPGQGSWTPDKTGAPRLDVGDPRSVDLGRLTADVGRALARGPVVIVDGLFAQHVRPATPCGRLDVFVDLAPDLRLARKIHRKCVVGGFPLDVVLLNYMEQRRDAHERHVEPLRWTSDVVLDGTQPHAVLVRQIWAAARERGLTALAAAGEPRLAGRGQHIPSASAGRLSRSQFDGPRPPS
jgi:uridine kinase